MDELNKIELIVDESKDIRVIIYYDDNNIIKKIDYAGVILEKDLDIFQKRFQDFLNEVEG